MKSDYEQAKYAKHMKEPGKKDRWKLKEPRKERG